MDRGNNFSPRVGITVRGLLLVTFAVLYGCQNSGGSGDVAGERECRATENLGSRIQRPVCMTREQWAEVDERDRIAREANAEETQATLRRALEQGSQVQGRAFDSPTSGPGY